MEVLLADGLAAGGLGFSSSLARNHTDGNGEPVPSRWSTTQELLALAAVCRAHPGTSLELLPHTGPRFPTDVVELMARMSVVAQRPLNWNIVQVNAGNTDEVEQKLQSADAARAFGGKVVGLFMPMTVATRFNLDSGMILDTLPGWAKPMALPRDEKLSLLRDPRERQRLADLANQEAVRAHLADWGTYEIREAFTPSTQRYVGRAVDEIALEEHKSPFDALVDIVVEDSLRTTFGKPIPPDSDADWEARARALHDPRIVVGASDAGAHLDMLATFSYTTMLLAQTVRERQLLTIEEAVRLLTAVPASLYGLRGRGRIAEGFHADVVVFDPVAVGSDVVSTRADLPGNAARLYAGSTGVGHVFVNGEAIVEDGRVTNALPGSILRSGIATATPQLQ
jgi:N-acyl-D-aspartate/D-glutamate deacylase